MLCTISALARATASPSVWQGASQSCCFITRTERGETSVESTVASACACCSSSSAATTRWTSPIDRASAASILRDVSSRSVAFAWPTMRGSIQAMPCSAISPRLANAVANTAFSDAMRKSLYSAMTSPRPAAAPLMALMMGLGAAGK
jgi:D-serine deaminase-like pyridoxal phosphate-dependent protein